VRFGARITNPIFIQDHETGLLLRYLNTILLLFKNKLLKVRKSAKYSFL
jgi:hypothetical protein